MTLNSVNWCDIHRVQYPCTEMCRDCLAEFVGELLDNIKKDIREEEEKFRCSIVSELRQMAGQTTNAQSANESSESSNTTKPSKSSTEKNHNFVRIVEKDLWGILLRKNLKSVWWGWHHSPEYQRWCLNLIPFLTLWWIKPGGKKP